MSAEDQIERLQAVARERGWTVPNVFSDRPATAKKDRRPSRTGTDRRDPVRRCAEGIDLRHRPRWTDTGRSGHVHVGV
jgi:hypothetical protein